MKILASILEVGQYFTFQEYIGPKYKVISKEYENDLLRLDLLEEGENEIWSWEFEPNEFVYLTH